MTTPLRHGPPRDSKARAVSRSWRPRPFGAATEAIPTGIQVVGSREPLDQSGTPSEPFAAVAAMVLRTLVVSFVSGCAIVAPYIDRVREN